ncbi:MAG TPA: sulfite exporter TauE/SafE family protein, partial [Beutenbergiaceae bacterium]|nr:sulfite exporter TauE/SafE family protein [Beutenbergiaceae bacterium]
MGGLEFSLIGWVVLVSAALAVGIAKTSIGGLGALAVAGFAMFIPARESTAAVLLILIIGDLVAVGLYRRSADWSMLRR